MVFYVVSLKLLWGASLSAGRQENDEKVTVGQLVDLNLALQITLSFLLRKFFDGVSQHGAGHFLVMGLQKGFFGLQMAFADFAQHPACGFMDQVLLVEKQDFGNLQCHSKLMPFDKVKGRHDRNSSFPQIFGFSQAVEHRLASVHQVGPDDVLRRRIHQVPIVNVSGIAKIDFIDGLSRGLIAFEE